MRVTVEGVEALRSTIADLPDMVQDEIKDHIHSAGRRIKATARANAPFDDGELQRSIDDEVSASGLTSEIGSRGVKHAAWTEFGTRRQRAQPWLFPAFRSNLRELRKDIRKSAADLPRKVRTRVKRDKRTRRPAS